MGLRRAKGIGADWAVKGWNQEHQKPPIQYQAQTGERSCLLLMPGSHLVFCSGFQFPLTWGNLPQSTQLELISLEHTYTRYLTQPCLLFLCKENFYLLVLWALWALAGSMEAVGDGGLGKASLLIRRMGTTQIMKALEGEDLGVSRTASTGVGLGGSCRHFAPQRAGACPFYKRMLGSAII